MKDIDYGLKNLLDLNGDCIVIDEARGLWVKFEAKKTKDRKHGVRYSLTLHNKQRERVLGFDNAHAIEYGAKRMVKPKRTYEHVHRYGQKEPEPYDFVDAATLLEDFWIAVDDYLAQET